MNAYKVLLTFAACSVAASQNVCAQLKPLLSSSCSIDTLCTQFRCTINYENVTTFGSEVRMHPCAAGGFNATWGFNQTSSGFAEHYTVNSTTSFYVKGLKVNGGPLKNSTVFALATVNETAPHIYTIGFALRDCHTINGTRTCHPKIPVPLMTTGVLNFTSVNCSAAVAQPLY